MYFLSNWSLACCGFINISRLVQTFMFNFVHGEFGTLLLVIELESLISLMFLFSLYAFCINFGYCQANKAVAVNVVMLYELLALLL